MEYSNGSHKSAKRNLKDSLFTFLFRDIKYLRQLYASLYDDEAEYSDEDFHLITLENILVNNVYNDLGLLVKDKLIILVEAQSTFNPNMAIRYLIYIANTYYNYIIEHQLNVFGTSKLSFPTPKFVLVYSGKKQFKSKTLKLSDCYFHEKEIPLELIVDIVVYNNLKMSILNEYILFCQKYDEFSKGTNDPQEKLKKLKQTIDYCVEHNILREFLKSKEGEVQEMMMQVFTQEQAMNIALMEKYKIGLTEGIEKGLERGIEKGLERGLEKGLEQGKKAEALLIAKNMKNKGFDYDLICTITGLTIHELESL